MSEKEDKIVLTLNEEKVEEELVEESEVEKHFEIKPCRFSCW